MATRIMWIENKSKGNGRSGPARIGRVAFSKSRKSLRYAGQRFQTLQGAGVKANYFGVDSGDAYWISGCRKDGRDALYGVEVEVDDDVREEYWHGVRNLPENAHVTRFRAKGTY